MNRGFLILVAVIIAGVGAALVTRHLLRGPSSAWLCHQYGLSPQKVGTIEGLQQQYGSRCGPYCDQMCEANAHLEQIALDQGLSQGTVTSGLREAVAETDRIRTETRIVMLEHFYAVAAELPPEKRRDYLLKVLPLVIDSCGSK